MKILQRATIYALPAIAMLCDAASAAAPSPKKVAILLFNNVEIIDYTGPYEVFGAEGYDVYTVSADKAPITTSMGMQVVPKFSFAEAPAADIVLIPGGGVQAVSKDAKTLDWIRKQSMHAGHVMSVCNGAYTLANTGLLKGLTATTTAGLIDGLRRQHPEINVVRDQRVVDNGKFITTGGLSAGIDGALHVVSLLEGEGEARAVAVGIEYDWHPEGGYLPATFAVHLLPSVGDKLAKIADWDKIVRYQGDAAQWEVVAHVNARQSASDLIAQTGKIYAAAGKWTSLHATSSMNSWRFLDSDGKSWTATLSVEDIAGKADQHLVKIDLLRATPAGKA